MTGWQRFFLLFSMCAGILICWPQYNDQGITFMVLAFILWCGIILFFSVLMNLFAIVKWEFLHRLCSIILLSLMAFSLLYYFPLKDGDTPFIRLKNRQWPTQDDVIIGLKRLTFSYDFVDKNVKQNHPIQDQINHISKIKKNIENKIQEKADAFEVIVDNKTEEE